MFNRRNTMKQKRFFSKKYKAKKRMQMPEFVLEDVCNSSKSITNNKLTKKVARLLVAGLIILIIISFVIIATVLS